MKPVDFFSSLSEDHKAAFALRVGSSLSYLRLSIFRRKGGARKRPSDELIIRIADASDGKVTLQEAIDYFLVEPVLRLAEFTVNADSSHIQVTGQGARQEVKPFDTNHKPSQLRRVVGRDFEQMGVGN